MKTAILATALFVSAGAYALPTTPMSLIQTQNDLFDASAKVDRPDPAVEADRIRHLKAAKTLEEAMDYMTPDEISAEFGLPTEKQFEQMSESDPRFLLQNVGEPIVVIDVNISSNVQRLTVTSPEGTSSYPISSARKGYHTALFNCGSPYSLQKMHYSRKYHNSPMPFSMFYKGGYAIHGTYETKHLGRPASHGCVRVHPEVAEYLFGLAKRYGADRTAICIHY
jgi:hypothetical protein